MAAPGNQVTKGTAIVGALIVRGLPANTEATYVGGVFTKLATSLTPPTLTTVTQGTITSTVTGARVGDLVFVNPPTNLEAGLTFVGARVTSNDTVTLIFTNGSAGTITPAAKAWDIYVLDLTP